jgi:hypothetical protein
VALRQRARPNDTVPAMGPCSWVARAAIACGMFGGVVSAYGGGAGDARVAEANGPPPTIDAPVRHSPENGGPSGGIGLGNFDAGPDAHWVEVDAAAFRGKTINGRLAPEKIQAVVRANFGTFRMCYENGLRASPSLQGRVTVKFVIDLGGRVTTSADEKSDLPDAAIVQCVVEGFRKLQFPKPEGGIVTVVYPIIFNPGD